MDSNLIWTDNSVDVVVSNDDDHYNVGICMPNFNEAHRLPRVKRY